MHAYAIQISPVRPAGPVPSALPALSIVVLPFANPLNDPEQEYFADGITDDVTTDLSRIADSFVISRSTAFTYKGSPVDARQIGRDLGVRYVLEGSVRRIGERVRINAQLIDAESGAHLWAERIETDCTDIAAAQDGITGCIARTLNLELVEAVGRRSERDQTVDPEARDLVWQGWAWYYRPRSREESLEQAQRAFERAFDIDPESVEAHIGIGTAISCALVEGFRRISADEQVRAERLLTKALERDAGRSMAHYGMGLLRRTQGRLIEAKIEFETAVSIDRNDAWSIGQLGQIFLHLGEPEAAIPYIERAMRLNPRDAVTHEQYTRLGGCYVMLGRADQAIDLLRRAQALPYRNWAAHYVYGAACGLMGDLEEAKSAVLELVKVRPEATSLSKLRELNPWWSPRYLARAETLFAGLRLAGFPDE